MARSFSKISPILFLLANALAVNAQFSGTAHFDTVFTEYFRRNSGGWTAGDATISIPLSDKRVIWLFGDSYIVDVDTSDNTLPCLFQIRNCMMVQDSIDRSKFTTYIDSTETGIYRTFFKLPGSSELQLLWPDHGFEFNDTVFIFLEHVDNATWEILDIYLAKLLMPGLQLYDIVPMPDMGDFVFGRCVLTDSVAGYRYLYGNKVNWIVWEPFVARCPLDGLFTPWEYWTGNGWSVNIMMISKISGRPVSPSFSVTEINGRYYMITQENGYLTCGLGRDIYSYESDSPTGPFTIQTRLYTEESKIDDHYLLTYNAYSHPYFTEDEELLISYNVNDMVDTLEPNVCPSQCKDVWTDRMDADSYRPKFIRVPVSLITGIEDDGMEARGHGGMGVFPNPANPGEEISLKPCTAKEDQIEICIRDIYGHVIFIEKTSTPVSFRAPVSPGAYIVCITSSKQDQFTGKLIVIP